jgi:diphosphomevalonate decarboxylase
MADQLDLVVLVCVTTESAKEIGSRDGMSLTSQKSPYYAAWLDVAPRIHAALKEALLARDLEKTCALAEDSALAMHASAFAAGVVYVSGATLAALAAVRALRADGIAAYATMDAGPHLKCLVAGRDATAAKARLAGVPGVLRIIEARAGEGARPISPVADTAPPPPSVLEGLR